MLMTAPVDWLHELAKGTIKTQWGQMMKAEDPAAETDKIFLRLEKDKNNTTWGIQGFMLTAPLLAERLAIAEYKKKNPMIAPVAPEILTYQEALEIALQEYQVMNKKDLTNLAHLLQTDESMKVITNK